MRRIATTDTKYPRKTIACMGDSLTDNYTWGVADHDFWPSVLAMLLNADGCHVKARNFGTSGEKSYQMMNRIACMYQFDVPDLGVIWAGQNDRIATAVTSITRADATATITTTANHGRPVGDVVQWVIAGADQAEYNGTVDVTITGAKTGTYSVTGTPATPATGTITYYDSYDQTEAYIEAMGEALFTAGVGRVLICSRHYLNYDSGSGGDNVGGEAVEVPSGSLWTAQRDAATDLLAAHEDAVLFVDIYSWFYDLLVANPTWVDDADLWQIASGNVHNSVEGNRQIALCIEAAIHAESGWKSALT